MRTWQVALIGGASGVGKTSVSHRLARHYGVGITELGDFQLMLEHTAALPLVHYWRDHPEEMQRMSERARLAYILRYSHLLSGALRPVIAAHLQEQVPIILEGDLILPSLAARSHDGAATSQGRVRAIFLCEDEEEQIRRNYLAREGHEQPARARGSALHNAWLRREAGRLGVTTLAARPWDTVLERAIAALG